VRDALVLAGAFAVSLAAIEIVVARKLQSALPTIALIHALGLIAALGLVRTVGVLGVLVFWSGLAACWFGVRSHIESSILFRLLHLLRQDAATREDVLGRYYRDHSEEARLDELLQSGLVVRTAGGLVPTAKGRFVARVAARLR
jgi:hypothetical protein